jgi:hypothetical protein
MKVRQDVEVVHLLFSQRYKESDLAIRKMNLKDELQKGMVAIDEFTNAHYGVQLS